MELVAEALDYGFRKQRDQYDIDISGLEPREAFVEAVRRLGLSYFNPDAMVLMGNFAGEVARTPDAVRHASRARRGAARHSPRKRPGPAPGARGRVVQTSTSTRSPPCASAATSVPSTEATAGRRFLRPSSTSCGRPSLPRETESDSARQSFYVDQVAQNSEDRGDYRPCVASTPPRIPSVTVPRKDSPRNGKQWGSALSWTLAPGSRRV